MSSRKERIAHLVRVAEFDAYSPPAPVFSRGPAGSMVDAVQRLQRIDRGRIPAGTPLIPPEEVEAVTSAATRIAAEPTFQSIEIAETRARELVRNRELTEGAFLPSDNVIKGILELRQAHIEERLQQMGVDPMRSLAVDNILRHSNDEQSIGYTPRSQQHNVSPESLGELVPDGGGSRGPMGRDVGGRF